jgi:hypothetical protein
VLLYVSTGEPEEREFRPLHSMPATVAGLFDLGMRHHVRKGALLLREADAWNDMPDWRLDRLVIRVAVYGRERLGLAAGDRVAIVGPLHWLWPVVEFAAHGHGWVPVGLSQRLRDGDLRDALAESSPRVAFATDDESARRLAELSQAAAVPETVVGIGTANGDPRHVALPQLLELGANLDTAERAQSFRRAARAVAAGGEACRHFGADGAGRPLPPVRLTHAQAMARVREHVTARPAQNGDLAYVEGSEVSVATRLSYWTFVGDGLTQTALGRAGCAAADLALLRPHKLLASAAALAESTAARSVGAGAGGWLGRLADVPGVGRLLRNGLSLSRQRRHGGWTRGVRWVETPGPLPVHVARALRASGMQVFGGLADEEASSLVEGNTGGSHVDRG